MLDRISVSDFVVGLPDLRRQLGGAKNLPRLLDFPAFEFAGFHPDIIPVRINGTLLQSPMGDYHSLMAAAGYRAGLSTRRVISMYNALTYRAFGYFDAFADLAPALIADYRKAGIEIAHLVERWRRRGNFTHSINHPKAYVVADLTYTFCKAWGLDTPRPAEYGDFQPDPLNRYAVYPVFPELARHLSLDCGSLVFKAISTPAGPHILSLAQFVERSFNIYAINKGEWTITDRIAHCIAYMKDLR